MQGTLWKHTYHVQWKQQISLSFNSSLFTYSLLEWKNDVASAARNSSYIDELMYFAFQVSL